MAKTKIEWTDTVLNPVTGCEKVSAGCDHCFAERMANRLQAMGKSGYQGIVDDQGHWTGKVNLLANKIEEPLHWKKPRKVFLDSMSDLFNWKIQELDPSFLDEVFAVMAATPHITYQVLTKRPAVMKRYLTNPCTDVYVEHSLETIYGEHGWHSPDFEWPLPNVWLGVSVEDQETADQRIPLLLQTPAAIRFVSYEPALGPWALGDVSGWKDAGYWWGKKIGIDWVICGGESGPGARPMHPDWARSLRDQCQAADIPFFFKSWGEWWPCHPQYGDTDRVEIFEDEHPLAHLVPGEELCLDNDGEVSQHWVGNNPLFEGWQPDPGSNPWWLHKIGKRSAGRLLDGVEWSQFPEGK